MSAFTFTCLLATFSLTMVGLPVLLIVMNQTRNAQERRGWQAVAAQLGLEVAPPTGGSPFSAARYIHLTMRGHRGGMRVRLDVIRLPSEHNSARYFTHLRVYFPEPLGAGFPVMPDPMAVIGPVQAFGLVGGGSPLGGSTSGNHDLGWAINASPTVVEALNRPRRHPFKLGLLDDGVASWASGMYTGEPVLTAALDDGVDLAQRVLAAYREMGPDPVGSMLGDVWGRVARSHGLTLEIEDRRMFGRCEGVHVCVDTPADGMHRRTRFTVRYDRPLGVGLQLIRENSIDRLGKLFGGQDIEVGDPEFDGRFIVRGEPAEEVRALLTPDVRAALVRMQSVASRLVVEDDHLMAEVVGLVTDEASLDTSLVAIARAGAALARVTHREVLPYRA